MRKYFVLVSLILILTIAYPVTTSVKNKLNLVSTPQPNSIFPSPDQLPLQTPTGPPPAIPFQLPQGYRIGVFAKNLGSPRDLEFSPLGTLLVSLPDEGKIVALPDKNNDGVADSVKVILSNLNRPHGLAFYNNLLFVAELNRVVRYTWEEGELSATPNRELFTLPYNGGHNTRSLIFNKQGQLFVSLGSSCNVCNENHDWLAGVIVSDMYGNNPHVFARGLRNSVFLTVNPETDELWAGDMGRDRIGDDIPREEINIIRDGDNYGWPVCYGQ
ncbi:MAG: PQQ-dependent sugar dehydrogenase [Patescibacteria group bacterium]